MRAAALLVLSVALPSCGYTLAGRPTALQGRGPFVVEPFFERPFVGMAQPMAQRLTLLLASDGVPVGSVLQQNAARLQGELRTSTVLQPTRAGIVAYALKTQVDARLIDATGTVLWHRQLLVADDFLPDATPDAQPLLTETNRQFTIARLAERAANETHTALLEDLAEVTP